MVIHDLRLDFCSFAPCSRRKTCRKSPWKNQERHGNRWALLELSQALTGQVKKLERSLTAHMLYVVMPTPKRV